MPARSAGRLARYDVVVLGGGSAGETVCEELSDEGLAIALVESARVGGICPFVACMPSKALLRSAGVRRLARLAAALGASPDLAESGQASPQESRQQPGGELAEKAYARAVRRRDLVADNRDDSEHVKDLEAAGVFVIRGRAKVTGAGKVRVERGDDATSHDRPPVEIGYRHLVIATGSEPTLPPVDGLADGLIPVWTSDDALSTDELPRRLAVLGGGPVGCELAQAFARFGVEVSIVEQAARVISDGEPEPSHVLAQALRRDGVQLHLGRKPERVEPGKLVLDDGSVLEVDRVLVAAGRRPRTGDLGLETLGVSLGEKGEIQVGARCEVEVQDSEQVWACGDVTGLVPFTHGAKHQARVVASNIAGRREQVSLDTVPRTVYTYPPLASVGLTRADAEQRGMETIVSCFDVSGTARALTEGARLDGGDEGGGVLLLVADARAGTLIGASAAAPSADEWISEATLAIKAGLPLSFLCSVVHPFPTFAEAYEPALWDLQKQQEWQDQRKREAAASEAGGNLERTPRRCAKWRFV